MQKRAAVGFRAHSGWTTMVVVCLAGADPVVLDRDRVHLVRTFSYKFRQPYHTAEKLSLAQARIFVSQVASGACGLALKALRGAGAIAAKSGHGLAGTALVGASGRTLPPFEKILASHALIHTADGELFREALVHASARLGLPVFVEKEKELLGQAATDLKLSENALLEKLTKLGRPLGSPWSRDEKFATLVAWLALVQPRHW